MAHYLSQVTLEKMEARRELVDRTDDSAIGIQAFQDVPGFFRCVAAAWSLSDVSSAASHRQPPTPGGSPAAHHAAAARARQHRGDVFVPPDEERLALPSHDLSSKSKRPSMWCGEQDGSITIRSGEAGTADLRIGAKPKTFVFALLPVRAGVMWAGLSDGFVRIFDTFTYRLIDEMRAHCGAVTAMALATMPGAMAYASRDQDSAPDGLNIAVTASADWTVSLWDIAAVQTPSSPGGGAASRPGVGVCLCRLNAHQSGVRCLAVDARSGGHLFASGADDGSICLWDLRKLAASDALPLFADGSRARRTAGSSHRSSFRNATAAALAADGPWPLVGAHEGAVSQLAFCGDSKATGLPRRTDVAGLFHVDPYGRPTTSERRRGATTPRGSQRYRHRPDAVASAYESRTRAAQELAARRFCLEERHNRYLVSASHDGAVRVWRRGNGQFVQEIEVRPCAVTSLLLDPVQSRLWIGGVDSVITVYDENSFDHITTLHDHSGSYVVAFHGVSTGMATSNLWALDAAGGHHYSKVGSQATDEEVLAAENASLELVHGLRTTVLRNFERLQELRLETDYLQRLDGRRKEKLAKVLGSNVALQQRYLAAVADWRNRSKRRTNSAGLAAWLFKTNAAKRLRPFWSSWYRWVSRGVQQRGIAFLSTLLREGREANQRRRYLIILQKAAEHREKYARLQRAAQALMNGNDYNTRMAVYHAWSRYLAVRRDLNARGAVAALIRRTTDEALRLEYWRRLSSIATSEEARRHQRRALEVLVRRSGHGMLLTYFQMWQEARPILRAARIERQTADCLEWTFDRTLCIRYYHRWAEHLEARRVASSGEAADQAERNVLEWRRSCEERADAVSDEINARRKAELEVRRQRIVAKRDRLSQDIARLERKEAALQRRKHLPTAHVDSTAPIEQQAHSVMAMVKARGVNCGYDLPTIELAREHCQTLEAGGTVAGDPLPQTRTSATSSPSSSRPPTPPAGGHRTTVATPSAKTRPASSSRGPGSTSTTSAAVAPKKPPLDAGLQRALRVVKQKLFTIGRGYGYRMLPAVAVVNGAIPTGGAGEEDEWSMEEDIETGARHHWGISISMLTDRLTNVERKEVLAAIKEVVVAYDVAMNAVAVAQMAAPSSSSYASSPRRGGSRAVAEPPRIRPGLLREFLMNAHLFLVLVQSEYETAIRLGVTAGDDYKDRTVASRRKDGHLSPTSPTSPTTPTSGLSSGDELACPRTPPSPASAPRSLASSMRGNRALALRAQQQKEREEAAAARAKAEEDRQHEVSNKRAAGRPKSPGSATTRVNRTTSSGRPTPDSSTNRPGSPPTEDAAPAVTMRPYLGFKVTPAPAGKSGPALKVASVAEGGPAEEAGIMAGDILLRFAKARVADMPAFQQVAARYAKIDAVLPVTIQREQKRLDVNIVVAGVFPKTGEEEPRSASSAPTPKSLAGSTRLPRTLSNASSTAGSRSTRR